MKNKKIIHRKYDDTIIDSITCDICKKTYSGIDWEKLSRYHVLETEVKLRTGQSFPEGGSGEEISFDVCPTCFIEKLIPALKELGAEPTKSEWDW
jgi:hypothetical protein